MKTRPFLLYVCAGLILLFPLEWVVRQFMGQPFLGMDFIVSFLMPIGIVVGLLRVEKYGWYTLFMFLLLFGIRDLYGFYIAQTHSLVPFLVHVGVYAFSFMYFINPRVRHLYFDTKLHWWRVKSRFETQLPFLMKSGSTWHYPIVTNISDGGCFVETHQTFQPDAEVSIVIPLPVALKESVLKAVGNIRWVSKNPLRPGVGIQFNANTVNCRKTLTRLVKSVA
jgi:Tfp pilus assembly protein PilZ